MNDKNLQPPEHVAVRTALRIAGPMMALVGLVFLAIGIGSFFSSFGDFEPPRYFWCAFVGMPLLAVGGVMCNYGYMGAVYRYMAGEVTPVASDVVNYIGENTQPGVKSAAKSLTEGILEAKEEQEDRK